MGALVVVTTVGNQEQANLIAEELVARRNACCVNILRVERSVYRWQGRMCDDSEYMLINPYGLMFDEITASSLVKIDKDSNVIDDVTGLG